MTTLKGHRYGNWCLRNGWRLGEEGRARERGGGGEVKPSRSQAQASGEEVSQWSVRLGPSFLLPQLIKAAGTDSRSRGKHSLLQTVALSSLPVPAGAHHDLNLLASNKTPQIKNKPKPKIKQTNKKTQHPSPHKTRNPNFWNADLQF